MCVAIRAFKKNTNLDAGERFIQVFNASSSEAYKCNVKSVREDNGSLPCENLDILFENIRYDVPEINERGSDFKVDEQTYETVHDVLLNEATLVVDRAVGRSNVKDEKMRIVFDEKAREDGFKVTTPEEAPYAVILRLLYGTAPLGVCSGSLITPRWVITAAHCFTLVYDKVIVYAGGNSVKEIDNDEKLKGSDWQYQHKVYTHPLYIPSRKAKYDVALVELGRDFGMTATVNTMNLSLESWKYDTYQDCELTGFGRVYLADQSVLDNTRKSHFLEVDNYCECVRLPKLMMCSRPRDDYGICSGDSGGGLICDGQLVAVAVGLIAFRDIDTCTVVDKHLTQECAVRNTLNIFVQICPYLQWVTSLVKSINQSSIDVQCYDPTNPTDYAEEAYYWGDDYHSDDYEDRGNFDTTIRTSNLLLLTCSSVLLIIRAMV